VWLSGSVTGTHEAPGRRSPKGEKPVLALGYQVCDVVTKKKRILEPIEVEAKRVY
jgi:hypothetical protein